MKIKKLCVSEVCDFVGGSQPPKSEFISKWQPGYVRLIQIRDYKTDDFITYIKESSTSKFCDKTDIMIGRYGPPIFQICRGIKGAYNVALMKAVPKKCIDKDYLYYFLKQQSLFEYIDKLSPRTGGQTGVDLFSLNNYPIKLPESLVYQKRIATVLSSLDAKIELNNRINAELEAMAKALYDYWFVQFDFPNAKGKPYKSSGGKMVWNEELKREIPAGWGVKAIGEWIAKDKTGDWGKDSIEGNYNLKVDCIRGADINGLNGSGDANPPTRYILEKNTAKILTTYDFIIEISGGSPTQSTGRMAYLIDSTINRFSNPLICSNFCKAITLKSTDYFFTFAYLWKSIYENNVLFGWEGKTSGIKNLLFDSFTSKYLTPYPPEHICKDFFDFAKANEEKKQTLLMENQELTALRDFLLPMLMNGQVKVG